MEGHITVKQSDRYVRYDLPYEPIAEGNGVLRPEIKIENRRLSDLHRTGKASGIILCRRSKKD